MSKLYIFFTIWLNNLPLIASSVIIEILPPNTPIVAHAFLPIEGYSNLVFPTEFVVDEGSYTLTIPIENTMGIVILIKNYSIEIPLYLTQNEKVRIILDTESIERRVAFQGTNADCHYKFYCRSNELMKEYIDLFSSFPKELSDSLILSTYRKETKRMLEIFECSNDSLVFYYKQDLYLDLMSSLHRSYRGKKELLQLYSTIVKEFNIDQGVRGSLEAYGYFYYLSYELPKNKSFHPTSSFYKVHEFLFSISDIDDRSYMLQMQFFAAIKMNAFTSIKSKCEAYNDIREIVINSNVNLTQYFMEYFPESRLCFN